MTLTMYDSVTIDAIPSDPPAVAGYVAGSWPNYEPLVARFPHAHHLSIAPHASEAARCLDVEPGDAANSEAVGWYVNHAIHDQGKAIPYTSASNVQALINALASGGIHRASYFIWSAHYTDRPHICAPHVCGYPQADLTQWTKTALGRNLDQSLVSDGVFAPAVDRYHYARYAVGPFDFGRLRLYERATAQEYDRLIGHPRKNRARIRVLRQHIELLRSRIAWNAHHERNGWAHYYRTWRWRRLSDRLSGPVHLV